MTVLLAWLVTVASAALATLAYLVAGMDVDHRRIDRDVHVHLTGADLAGPAFLLLAVVIEVIVIAWHRRTPRPRSRRPDRDASPCADPDRDLTQLPEDVQGQP